MTINCRPKKNGLGKHEGPMKKITAEIIKPTDRTSGSKTVDLNTEECRQQ